LLFPKEESPLCQQETTPARGGRDGSGQEGERMLPDQSDAKQVHETVDREKHCGGGNRGEGSKPRGRGGERVRDQLFGVGKDLQRG